MSNGGQRSCRGDVLPFGSSDDSISPRLELLPKIVTKRAPLLVSYRETFPASIPVGIGPRIFLAGNPAREKRHTEMDMIDMRRYARLHAGASWIAEYGDPDNPEDWGFLKEISAYHNAVPGRPYPPILIATSRRDDRVHPGHARKMAAKLQTMGYEAYFSEPAAGGHSAGKDHAEQAANLSLGYGFLRRAIGWQQ